MSEEDLGFLQHLEDIRKHIIRAFIILTLGFGIAYGFHKQILGVLVRPVMGGLRNHGIYALQTISVTEGIMTYIKAAFVAGFALSMPLLLREVWLFVAPGLYPKERKVVLPSLFVLFLFFIAGMMFSYFFFVPFVVDFLASMTPTQALLVPRLSEVFSLSLLFYLVFGVIFEVPLIMFILSFLGIFHAHQYLRASKYFVVASFIIGALFSPPDPLSQVLLAVPLCALYGLGILASLAAGRSGGVVSALRVLGGMAITLILLTVAGYYIARAAKTEWVHDPLPVMAAGECVQYLDLDTLRIQEDGQSEGNFTRKTGKTSAQKWINRLKPPTPAGLWCKGKKHDLVMTARPGTEGLEFHCRGRREAIKAIEDALPGQDWPRVIRMTKDAFSLEVWLPRAGIRDFVDKAFENTGQVFGN